MQLSEIHDCDKCRGKIVCITRNNRGQTCCGYCHEPVDYTPYYDEIRKDPEYIKMLEKLKKKHGQ